MVPLLAVVLAASPGTPSLAVPFERYTLPNGLTVLLHEDHRLPTVTVNLWFDVGSADEKPGRTGFAHLFEHLMFMGTAAVPDGQFDQVMEKAGGGNNATTSNDRTNYFDTGPSGLLETFLWLEADRLGHLGADMTKKKVDLQRDVVKNERRQSYENRPYGLQEPLIMAALFPPEHPYHHPVIGSHADLTAASVDDVKAFFRDWYVTTNASLVIAGDFEPAAARALVTQYLGALPRGEAPLRTTPQPVRLAKAVRQVQPDDVQQQRLVLAWPAPAAWARGDGELQVLALALGEGKTSRLVKRLVLEQQLAESVDVEYEPLRGAGVFVIAATAQGQHTAAELEQALDAELARLDQEPLTAAEVERARLVLEKAALTRVEMIDQRADLLNRLQHELGDAGLLAEALLGRFERVSASDVQEWSRRVLHAPRFNLAFVPRAAKPGGAK